MGSASARGPSALGWHLCPITCRFLNGSCGCGGVGGCIWLQLCEPVLLHQQQAGGCHQSLCVRSVVRILLHTGIGNSGVTRASGRAAAEHLPPEPLSAAATAIH